MFFFFFFFFFKVWHPFEFFPRKFLLVTTEYPKILLLHLKKSMYRNINIWYCFVLSTLVFSFTMLQYCDFTVVVKLMMSKPLPISGWLPLKDMLSYQCPILVLSNKTRILEAYPWCVASFSWCDYPSLQYMPPTPYLLN